MISCLFIANPAGKVLVLRLFRGDVTRDDALIFCRNVLSSPNENHLPTYRYEKLNFFRVSLDDLSLVALTRKNGNAFLVLHTLSQLKKLLFSFFSGLLTEENIVNNACVVYELFDESIDAGYTQNLEHLVLGDVMATKALVRGSATDPIAANANRLGFLTKFAVNPETFLRSDNEPFEGKLNDSEECLDYSQHVVTLMATSVVPPWRKFRNIAGRNTIHVDLVENMNVLYNHNSALVSYEVLGSLVVNSQLVGTPLVHLRMNDDFNQFHFQSDYGSESYKCMNNRNYKSYQTNANSSQFQLPVAAKQLVKLDDYKFHQCVNLDSIKANKTISFIPPDGMFVLLCYRSTSSATIPFLIRPKVKMVDSLNISYSVSLSPTYSKSIIAQRVVMKIPIPKTTKEVVPGTVTSGTSLDVNLSQHYVNWTFRKLQGETTYLANFNALLASNRMVNSLSSVSSILSSIKLEFVLPWFSSSGLYISSIECTNSKGKVLKHVNYTTKGGLYQHRLRFM